MPSSRASDLPSSSSSSSSSWDTTLALVDVFGRAPEEFGVASPAHSTPTSAQSHPWSPTLSSPMSPGNSKGSNGSATCSGEPFGVAAAPAAQEAAAAAPWEDDPCVAFLSLCCPRGACPLLFTTHDTLERHLRQTQSTKKGTCKSL